MNLIIDYIYNQYLLFSENCEVTAKQEKTGNQLEQFHLGYQECMSETMQFLVESEGFFSGDSLCVRLMNHLTKHCEKILTSKLFYSLQLSTDFCSALYLRDLQRARCPQHIKVKVKIFILPINHYFHTTKT